MKFTSPFVDPDVVDRVVTHAWEQYQLRQQIAREKARAATATKAFLYDAEFCRSCGIEFYTDSFDDGETEQ
jgi:hypothetical protein